MNDAPTTRMPPEKTKWKAGDRVDFDNGGSVIVHWTDDKWIGFSTHYRG